MLSKGLAVLFSLSLFFAFTHASRLAFSSLRSLPASLSLSVLFCTLFMINDLFRLLFISRSRSSPDVHKDGSLVNAPQSSSPMHSSREAFLYPVGACSNFTGSTYWLRGFISMLRI